jgi:hypothetical protein
VGTAGFMTLRSIACPVDQILEAFYAVPLERNR